MSIKWLSSPLVTLINSALGKKNIEGSGLSRPLLLFVQQTDGQQSVKKCISIIQCETLSAANLPIKLCNYICTIVVYRCHQEKSLVTTGHLPQWRPRFFGEYSPNATLTRSINDVECTRPRTRLTLAIISDRVCSKKLNIFKSTFLQGNKVKSFFAHSAHKIHVFFQTRK